MINHTIIELLTEQRLRDLARELPPAELMERNGSGMRAAIAAALVRWGLRLDPAAGEQVRALRPARIAPEGRR